MAAIADLIGAAQRQQLLACLSELRDIDRLIPGSSQFTIV